ncbi:hypothetical protein HDK90DRAFT_556923 [Phyllosticta capitalensis]|uniref:Uncharacterized protein n=1 Tax=Phyllosticta capitalensis TaxID=121624 RepID=A0ABR1YK70_9PEZI
MLPHHPPQAQPQNLREPSLESETVSNDSQYRPRSAIPGPDNNVDPPRSSHSDYQYSDPPSPVLGSESQSPPEEHHPFFEDAVVDTSGRPTQTSPVEDYRPFFQDAVDAETAHAGTSGQLCTEDDEYENEGYGMYRGELQAPPVIEGWDDPILTPLTRALQLAPAQNVEPVRQYMHDFLDSYISLVRRVWEEEKLQDDLYKTFMTEGVAILAGMSREMIACIMEGMIARLAHSSRAQAKAFVDLYQAEMERTCRDGRFQPCIYAQYFCDDQGHGPSVPVLRQILDALIQYLDDDQFAAVVDEIKFPHHSTLGHRRYTKQENREDKLRQFVAHVRKRIDHEGPTRPFSEFGFTNNHHRRLEDHARHHKSNFIMNLMEAVSAVIAPGVFKVKQFIIYMCWGPEQGWVGEILLNCVGLGYITSGHRMSYGPARHSNNFAGTMSVEDCNRWARKVNDFSPLRETLCWQEKVEMEKAGRR